MRNPADVFHLAIPALNLDDAQRFYVEGLGCTLARRYDDRITLNFFGDQVVCHLSDSIDTAPALYPRHFGVTFRAAFHVGAESVAALLMVGTMTGILMATALNNGGGAWDNAKKFIETGQYGGKGSDAHKAAVVGDTVGDPFKDTAGPSLHVLIKLLSTITLVMAPLFI